MYNVFFSYNSLDHAVVEQIAKLLKQRDLTPFLDRWYLVPGISWVDALERPLNSCSAVAIFIGAHGMGRWQQRERDLALDRQTREPWLPVIPVLFPGADPPLGFLSQNTWVDLRNGLTAEAIEILACAIQGKYPGADLTTRIASTRAGICPYRGLRPFREEDELFFCGRETFTGRLVEAVSRRNLIALVGASGSGKSSVVRAGLIPQLRRQRDCVWDFVIARPQDRPMYNLAACLVPLLQLSLTEVDQLEETAKLAKALTSGTVEIRDIVSRILAKQPGTDRLLIVIDQWEELYTLSADETARQRFISELEIAAATPKCSVVITVRADFYGHVVSNRLLSDRLAEGVINIGPMTREELKLAISDPARKNGLRFEDGLVGRILGDVGEEPGNLPLLEFLLTELWEKRQGPQLELASYEEIGGVRRAIAERAEKSFALLDNDTEREAARWALLSLVVPVDNAADTRRRAALDDLSPAARAVIDKFAADRLLVTTRDAAGRDVVEVGHEALIREWDRLRGWVNENREFLRTLRRVEEDETAWKNSAEDPSLLLPAGRRLIEAEELLTSRPQQVGSRVRAYIAASSTAERGRQEELAAAEREKQETIRRAERRVVVRTQIFGAVAIVLSIAVGVAAIVAHHERATAETQAATTIEFSKAIIAKAGALLGTGGILTQSVKEILDITEDALRRLLEAQNSNEGLKEQQIGLLLTVSDVYVHLGKTDDALSRARNAEQLITNSKSSSQESQRLLWASGFRMGDALVQKGDNAGALKKYVSALEIAERLSQATMSTQWLDNLLFTHDKVGEVLRIDGKLDEALKHYNRSLQIEEKLLEGDPTSTEWRHRMSATKSRIGDILLDRKEFENALREYETALTISQQVADLDPKMSRQVTLSVRYSRIGSILIRLGNRNDGLKALRQAMSIRKQLAERDPSNASYENYLASSFIELGDSLISQKETVAEALQNYRDGVRIRQKLVEKDGANETWAKRLATAQVKLNAALAKQEVADPKEAQLAK